MILKRMQASTEEVEQLISEYDRLKPLAESYFDLNTYCRLNGNEPQTHHSLLNNNLMSLERGEIDRLMVFMPPGSAKSTYSTINFPSWYMGRNPTHAIISCSHTAELAERFGRRVRNIVASDLYNETFGIKLASDSQAAGRWANDKGGEYLAAGVGGAITGWRGDLGIIDDPVKSREDADSDRASENTWDWYKNDFLTRLKPNAKQLIIMTRWREHDLAGRILEREADKWRVISLPMEAVENDPLGRKPGERLWPEWFTPEMVEQAKLDVRGWNALYQQNPVPESGDYFKAEWFTEYDQIPPNLTYYGASDYAVTDGAGDYTEHGVFGVDSNNNIYVIDWWRGQTGPDVWIERVIDLIGTYKPACWFGESGPIRRSIEPFLMKRMQERQIYCRIEWLPSITDKTVRARGIQARASMGKVWFPKVSKWKADILGQLLKFPAGRYDDAVDVFGLIGRGLETITGKRQSARVEINFHAGAWMG